MSPGREIQAEGLDEGAFPRPRHPGDADADGLAGIGEQVVEEGGGGERVVDIAALDQGDGLGQSAISSRPFASSSKRVKSLPPSCRSNRALTTPSYNFV